MKYIPRNIDRHLQEWKDDDSRKPLLLRGARQVGKSSAVRHLGKSFKYYAEVNFEKDKGAKTFFEGDINVREIASKLAKYIDVPILAGETLLFFDEVQECPEAIMALRFFKEDYPELHVIAAGSLLEFTLEELPTYGVGRIRSLFMYPMTFDEFAVAVGNQNLLDMRDIASAEHPLDVPFHEKLVDLFRMYILVGGMPEAVSVWAKTHDFHKCHRVHQDIILSYEEDFNKYKKRVNAELMRTAMRGVCHQIGGVVMYSAISRDYRSEQIKDALRMLELAGIIHPVVATSANGLPLDAETNEHRKKYLFLDTGLLLAILQLDGSSSNKLIELILTGSPQDLVNKGSITEMLAGLEMLRNREPIQRNKSYFWEKTGKSIAEVDYLIALKSSIIPIEVKSGTQGGMKSLWMLMHDKHLANAIRISFENFGKLEYVDTEDADAIRHVFILPMYAIKMLFEP